MSTCLKCEVEHNDLSLCQACADGEYRELLDLRAEVERWKGELGTKQEEADKYHYLLCTEIEKVKGLSSRNEHLDRENKAYAALHSKCVEERDAALATVEKVRKCVSEASSNCSACVPIAALEPILNSADARPEPTTKRSREITFYNNEPALPAGPCDCSQRQGRPTISSDDYYLVLEQDEPDSPYDVWYGDVAHIVPVRTGEHEWEYEESKVFELHGISKDDAQILLDNINAYWRVRAVIASISCEVAEGKFDSKEVSKLKSKIRNIISAGEDK